MSADDFKPWRTQKDPDELLEAQAGATWKALLDESRRCVDALKQVTREADRRLGLSSRMIERWGKGDVEAVHDKIERQIAAFEVRLSAMESRLIDRESRERDKPAPPSHPMPTDSSPKRKAA